MSVSRGLRIQREATVRPATAAGAAAADDPLEPQVRRWMPLAVPGLAVLICASIVLVWSIL